MLKFFRKIMMDAKSIEKRDPACKSILEVLFLYPGFHAVVFHRISHFLYNKKFFSVARFISQVSRFATGVEIHPGAKIGLGLFIDHGMGLVVGETAEIGDNCTLYHGVTLGGTGKDKGKRHPTIGNHVLISAGAKILGPFKVGDNARIGANAVVLYEVEANTTVVGVPGKAVKKGNEKVKVSSEELDQIHTPDPIAQELCKLIKRIKKLEEKTLDKEIVKDLETSSSLN